MNDIMQYGAIVVIAGLIGEAVKVSPIPNKYIPTIVGVAGGALGVVGMIAVNNFPATDPLNAVAIGVVSGLAATGAHQVIHQFAKGEEKSNEG